MMSAASRIAAALLAVAVIIAALPIVQRAAHAEEPDFAQRYRRDYNIYSPSNRDLPSNPLGGVNRYDPSNPFNPVNRDDPSNPLNPINRFNADNPFNPANEYDPANPLNPVNRYNLRVPFEPLPSH